MIAKPSQFVGAVAAAVGGFLLWFKRQLFRNKIDSVWNDEPAAIIGDIKAAKEMMRDGTFPWGQTRAARQVLQNRWDVE